MFFRVDASKTFPRRFRIAREFEGAKIADGAIGSAQLASSVVLNGTVTGDGSGLTNLNVTNITGIVQGTFTWQTVTGTNQ